MPLRPSLARLLGPLVAGAALAVVVAFAVRRGTASVDVFEQGAAALAGIAAIVLGMASRPAWPLSIGLTLTAFSGHWGDMGIPLPLDRVLLLTAIASTLIRERIRREDALRLRPVDLLLVLAAVYAVGSSLLAGTIGDHDARYVLLDRFSLFGFALFFVAPKALREERDRRVLLGTLVVLGGYLGLTALFETTGPKALVIPHYISNAGIGHHADRARGPFTEAAANGIMLFFCGVAAVLAVWTWRKDRARRLAGLVVGLCGLGILLTVTRAAWIAAGAGGIIAMLAVREARRYMVPMLALGAVGVITAFAVVPGLQNHARERTHDDKPLWDRENSNAAALRMIAARPLLGFGWGRFTEESLFYYRQARDYPLTGVRNLHNVYLANAVDLGLLGAALWLLATVVALGGSIARRGPPELRSWRVGFVAVAACYAISALSTPLTFALPTLLLWTWGGLLRAEP